MVIEGVVEGAMVVVAGVEVMVEDVVETDMEVEVVVVVTGMEVAVGVEIDMVEVVGAVGTDMEVVVVETDTEEVEETDMVVVVEVTDMGVEALVTGVVEQTLEEEMKKFSQKIRYLFKDYHRTLELRI